MLPTTCLWRNLFQNRPSQKAPDTLHGHRLLSLSGVPHTQTDLERDSLKTCCFLRMTRFVLTSSLVDMSAYPCTARMKHCYFKNHKQNVCQSTLILDVQPPELREINARCLSPGPRCLVGRPGGLTQTQKTSQMDTEKGHRVLTAGEHTPGSRLSLSTYGAQETLFRNKIPNRPKFTPSQLHENPKAALNQKPLGRKSVQPMSNLKSKLQNHNSDSPIIFRNKTSITADTATQ